MTDRSMWAKSGIMIERAMSGNSGSPLFKIGTPPGKET